MNETNLTNPVVEAAMPPQDINCERAILGSMMIDSGALSEGCERLSPKCFYSTANEMVFNCLCNMHAAGIPADVVTLADELRQRGELESIGAQPYLAFLVEDIATTANISHYCAILWRLYRERNFHGLAGEITSGMLTVDEAIKRDDEIRAASEVRDTSEAVHAFSWDDDATETPPMMKFQDTPILSPEGIVLITGPAGKGKSNIMLASAASIINPECDAIGFSILEGPAIYVDTENPTSIFTKNVRRCLMDRAGLPERADYQGIEFRNIRCLETFEQRQEWLFNLMQEEKYRLYLIDGAGDFVLDVNDSDTCVSFVSRLCAATMRHQCGVFVSLHGNPVIGQEKARGVLGSELIRKVDCSLLLKVEGDNHSVTTEFALGKNRAAGDKLTQHFEWDPFQKMHVSCAVPAAPKGKTSCDYDTLLEIGRKQTKWSHSGIVDAFCSQTNKSSDTAKRRLKDAIQRGGATQNDDGTYTFSNEKQQKAMDWIHD